MKISNALASLTLPPFIGREALNAHFIGLALASKGFECHMLSEQVSVQLAGGDIAVAPSADQSSVRLWTALPCPELNRVDGTPLSFLYVLVAKLNEQSWGPRFHLAPCEHEPPIVMAFTIVVAEGLLSAQLCRSVDLFAEELRRINPGFWSTSLLADSAFA